MEIIKNFFLIQNLFSNITKNKIIEIAFIFLNIITTHNSLSTEIKIGAIQNPNPYLSLKSNYYNSQKEIWHNNIFLVAHLN